MSYHLQCCWHLSHCGATSGACNWSFGNWVVIGWVYFVCHIALFCVVIFISLLCLWGWTLAKVCHVLGEENLLLTAHSCSVVVVISLAYGMLALWQRGQRSEYFKGNHQIQMRIKPGLLQTYFGTSTHVLYTNQRIV